jgi:hypothetical protein
MSTPTSSASAASAKQAPTPHTADQPFHAHAAPASHVPGFRPKVHFRLVRPPSLGRLEQPVALFRDALADALARRASPHRGGGRRRDRS